MNIIGRLTKDAEISSIAGDRHVVNFSIVANDSYCNKQGERIEQTTYFDCAYRISFRVAQYLTYKTTSINCNMLFDNLDSFPLYESLYPRLKRLSPVRGKYAIS